MPTPNPKVQQRVFEDETRVGLLIGYHVQSGGLCNGDLLIADYDPFK